MLPKLARTFLRTSVHFTNKNQQIRLASTAKTYKAAVLTGPGQPLVIEEKPQPKLGKTDVRIKVHYCSVNSIDCMKFRTGTKSLPFIPGYELSGEVIELGKEVTVDQLNIGERIGALSLEKFGGFAEECVVSPK